MHVTSPISAGDDALISKSRSSRFSLHARKKKNLLFPIPQVQKLFPPFDPVEKVFGKIRQTISLK